MEDKNSKLIGKYQLLDYIMEDKNFMEDINSKLIGKYQTSDCHTAYVFAEREKDSKHYLLGTVKGIGITEWDSEGRDTIGDHELDLLIETKECVLFDKKVFQKI